ncbi:MAG TPA: hypothetical protein VHO03_02190 [Ignavibacteriales bacterium]|nr:hypothetical protein [Ignavibacteriales bacterium]
MKKNLINIIAAMLLIISSGCEDLNNPGEIKIKNSLFFNLQVNSSRQHVYIYRNPDLSGRSDYYAADPFANFFNKDAVVTLKETSGAQSTGFTLTQDTVDFSSFYSGYYSSPNPYKPYYTNSGVFEAKPLTDYYLSVNADGEIVTGKVTTPGDFNITSPREGQVIRAAQNLDKFILSWSSSKNAMKYDVRINFVDAYFKEPVWFSFGTADTSIVFKSLGLNSKGIASGGCILQIVAFDDNYIQHYYNKKEIVGLSGAYGCFSSSVVREVRFRYVSD